MRSQIGRPLKLLTDILVLSAAFWVAFLLRFEFSLDALRQKQALLVWPYALLLKVFLIHAFRVHLFVWRYIGLRDVVRIFTATLVGTIVLAALRLIGPSLTQSWPDFEYAMLPLGVIGIDFTFSFLGIAGVRVIDRVLWASKEYQQRRQGIPVLTPTILIGAGQAGAAVAEEVRKNPQLGIQPAGFLDDDPNRAGHVLCGVPVLGTTVDLEAVCRKHGIRHALITLAEAPRKDIRRIVRMCDKAHIKARIIPGLWEIVGGQVSLTSIRNVAIEDLLGRAPAALDSEAISGALHDQVVMVTGAGGSIGSELCRQIARFQPRNLLLVEHGENNLFHIHRELLHARPDLCVTPLIADVTDSARMEEIFACFKPWLVFHAAAHKHVPMMEWNPAEAIKNNILGTRLLADLSHQAGVQQFVMISTDKAVNPTSVMGASKRVAEIYVQALAQRSKTQFTTVRFGNVLGSSGSVVPIFQEQIARGGPVTVTHPDMRRYFMTIMEACQLVLQAATMGKGGEIFILDMGKPIKILQLAKDMIRLSGLRVGTDIEIKFSGVRPGEKLFEELSVSEENAEKTRHPRIFIGRTRPHEWQQVVAQLESLVPLLGKEPAAILAALAQIVPEYCPPGTTTVQEPAAQELAQPPVVSEPRALAGGPLPGARASEGTGPASSPVAAAGTVPGV